MDLAAIQIRRLGPNDACAFREIRLEALRCDPEAFGSTFEVENKQPLIWFSERLVSAEMFGAFRGPELVGIAGLRVHEGLKESHKGRLVSMFVRSNSRNAGIGQRLVEAVVDRAQERVELVQLSVVSGNEPALQLYLRLGFVEYGLEKNALKQDGRYYDEVLMAKDLRPVQGVS